MMCLGIPQYLTKFLKNNQAASLEVQSTMVGMKVAYFEKLSTTTIIIAYPSDLGKEVWSPW